MEGTLSPLDRIDVLKKVIDILPVGVWLIDRGGMIIYGNDAGQRIWAGARYVDVEHFGEYKGWWVHNGKRIESEQWAAARAIRNGEVSLNEEVAIECFDGSRKIILNSAMPIRDEAGAIVGAIIVNHDITESKRFEAQLRELVERDPLTNAHNRRSLHAILDAELGRVRRYGIPLSMIMFDVDHFKQINDDYGHQAGDSVLVSVADVVREELRSPDRLGRWGGEEFLVIAPNTGHHRAVVLAERLRTRIADTCFDHGARVTCSFGVCEYVDDEDADAFIRRADDLMYLAKRRGRNNVAM
jgi:diguanylate cyclase (GGDEF)-like protein/PAS domain S-box-containing protein